jgi:signal transduction histidine kinase
MAVKKLPLIPSFMNVPEWAEDLNMPALIYQESSRTIWSNSAFDAVFGDVDFEKLFRPCSVEHPDLRPLTGTDLSQPGTGQYRILKNSHDQIFTIHLKTSVLDSTGERKFIVLIENVTSSFKEPKMAIQKEKLEHVGRYASGILHNLSQPLQTLQQSIEQLTQNQALTSSAQDQIHELGKAVDYLFDIVSNFRSFVGNVEEKSSTFTADDCIAESVFFTKNTLIQNNIDLIYERRHQENAIISGKQNQLTQILVNLITNAKDAIEQSGIARGTIIIEQQVEKNEIQISIKDNGCGMDEITQKKIFGPFFTTKPFGRGSGIGLSSSLFYLQNMNAKINVKSETGSGSAFTLTFPIHHSKGETDEK